MGTGGELCRQLALGGGLLLLAGGIMAAARKGFATLTPYSLRVQLVGRDNPALGLVLMGYFLAVIAALCGAVAGHVGTPPVSWQVVGHSLLLVAGHSVLSLTLVLAAGLCNDRLALRGIHTTEEVMDRGNLAVATVVGCAFLASGLLVAGSLHGRRHCLEGLALAAGGQMALLLYARLFPRVMRYRSWRELGEEQNLALGIALGGHLLAYGMVLLRCAWVVGAVPGLPARLGAFGVAAAVGALLLLALRTANDRLFLPGTSLRQELLARRNLNAGVLEAALAVAVAAVIVVALRLPAPP